MTGPRWTGPTNRPGTPDSWSGDVVADAHHVLGEAATGNSLTACLLREVEWLRAGLARERAAKYCICDNAGRVAECPVHRDGSR